MSKIDNYIKFDGELVRVVCSSGHVYVGKCHFYSELNDDDDLSIYVRVKSVSVPIDEIEEITEVKD